MKRPVPNKKTGAITLPAKGLTVLLADVRQLIVQAQEGAARAVDVGLTTLYWQVGERIRQDILREKRAGYGEQVVSSLSVQLEREFGRGFGEKNLRRMSQFAEAYPDREIVVSLLRQLGWTHFLRLIPIGDPLKRDFYAEMCRVEKWSTRTLHKKIQSMLYERTALSKKPDNLMILREKPFSTREEERLLVAAGRVFENDYPNPDRQGCPGTEIVKAIAFRKIAGEEAEKWRDHFMRCSPCTREYMKFRRKIEREKHIRAVTMVAAAAALVVILGWHGYDVRKKRVPEQAKAENPPAAELYQARVLDLKARVLLRGEDHAESNTPAELQKGRVALSIYLPIGSDDGDYQLRVIQKSKNPVLATTGTAHYGQDHIAILEIKLDLTSLPTGVYVFAIRKPDWSGWREFPVYLK